MVHVPAPGSSRQRPLPIVERLIAFGAWRSLRTAVGERAVDIAARTDADHLIAVLTPQPHINVQAETLQALETQLHKLIRDRAADLIDKHQLRLPAMEILTEVADMDLYFPIPGMYGGFRVRLEPGQPVRLIADTR